MSDVEPGAVVKEEILDNDYDVEYVSFEVNCASDIKNEGGILTDDGRRRSRRLRLGPLNTGLKGARAQREEDYRQKLQRKYARKRQKLARMSEEELLIRKEKQRQYYINKRQREKELGITPKRNSNKRKPRSKPAKPRTEETRQKQKFLRIVKEAEMTEEELNELKMKRFLQQQAYKASKTKEEWEKIKEKRREAIKKRAQDDEDYRQRRIERFRKWKENLSEEKKKKYKESLYRSIRKYQDKKINEIRGTEQWLTIRDKATARLKEKFATESADARQKRLLGYRINQAKRNLKKKLEKEGVAPEIIQRRVEELLEEMKKRPMPPPSQYKPREKKIEEEQDTVVKRRKCGQRRRNGISTSKDALPSCDPKGGGVHKNNNDSIGLDNFQHFQPGETLNLPMEKTHALEWKPQVETSFIILPSAPVVVYPVSGVGMSVIPRPPPFMSQLAIASVTPYVCEPLSEDCTEQDHASYTHDFSPPSSLIAPVDDPYEREPSPEPVICEEQKLRPTSPTWPPAVQPPPGTFNCTHCPQVLSSDEDLRSHLRTYHSLKCWKCPKCSQVMLSPTELSEHFKSHLLKSESYPTTALRLKPIAASVPSRSLQSSRNLKTKPDNFICMKCPFKSLYSTTPPKNKFKTLELLSSHVKKKHPKSFWPCSMCKVLKYSEDRLRFHKKRCLVAIMESKKYDNVDNRRKTPPRNDCRSGEAQAHTLNRNSRIK